MYGMSPTFIQDKNQLFHDEHCWIQVIKQQTFM